MTELNANSNATPGVIALPPLIYLAGLASGIALEFVYPLPLIESPLSHFIGWPLLALSLSSAIWGVSTMRKAGTDVDVRKPDTALVTGGPFHFSRNPLYISLTLLYLAVSILVKTLWPLFFLPFVLLVMIKGVIVREERHLERLFGEQYMRYKERTRRWL